MGVARIGSSKVGSLGRVSQDRVPRIGAQHLEGPEVVTPIDDTNVSTNSVAQGCLELIEVLEMCGDRMP